jgi:hypothetical protein
VELTRGKLFKLYAQFREHDRSLIAGDPSIPLNSKISRKVGFDVDYPIFNRLTLGGNAEYESYDADIGSYRRRNIGGYFQIDKILKGNVRVFADSYDVDNLDSEIDVDLIRAGVRFYSRPWNRTNFNADYVYENDDGGPTERSSTRASMRFNWAYRQVKLTAEYRYDVNEYGGSERQRNTLNLYLSRKF